MPISGGPGAGEAKSFTFLGGASRKKQKKEMVTDPYLSVITLNVNELNAPTKRQRLAKWIQK